MLQSQQQALKHARHDVVLCIYWLCKGLSNHTGSSARAWRAEARRVGGWLLGRQLSSRS
jgi:hypothetical protein